MLHHWRTRRRLQRRIEEDWAKVNALSNATIDAKEHRQLLRHIRDLSMYNSALLLKDAERLAIDVPSSEKRPVWWQNDYEDGMPDEAVQEWLSKKGKVGVKKLIQIERRANFEWWFTKIILPVLQILVPILALIVGLVSVSRK